MYHYSVFVSATVTPLLMMHECYTTDGHQLLFHWFNKLTGVTHLWSRAVLHQSCAVNYASNKDCFLLEPHPGWCLIIILVVQHINCRWRVINALECKSRLNTNHDQKFSCITKSFTCCSCMIRNAACAESVACINAQVSKVAIDIPSRRQKEFTETVEGSVSKSVTKEASCWRLLFLVQWLGYKWGLNCANVVYKLLFL